ncbi:TerB family tellurite resistance protein [Leptospira ognonensis]|uniref:TerB family tellurite resistance protein n=1 Tax=Leptospira ognonensis TaxID=2484945 RepID=A0A4R9K4G8_9LEPT|nr:TerB family tellurite resistance protein [Leptospira ognonensis]TGL60356.1 TerB family tellurite resistance protein [Leptospira ognonensis]
MAKKIVHNLKQGKAHKNAHPDSLQSDLGLDHDLHVEYAKILVSLWSYACNVDGQLKKGEGELVADLVNVLFEPDCLLSEYRDRKKEVLAILSETFESPLPMKTVAKSVIGNDQYCLNFYEDAVCIVASDGNLNPSEVEFLNELANELQISPMDKHQVEKKYLGSL